MKTVLAFGDSLTWGADAATGGRHAFEDRWPTVLEKELGGLARIIPEGLSGRTTSMDDHASLADLNGVRALPMLLASHTPLDAVVIMLGTNDLKSHICGKALGAALGMRHLIEIVQAYPFVPASAPRPEVVVVSPPLITAPDRPIPLNSFAEAGAESTRLAALYRSVASDKGCIFFDAGAVATATPVDGVHLDAANTRSIGQALAPFLRRVLGG